jgi:hypothetical protein
MAPPSRTEEVRVRIAVSCTAALLLLTACEGGSGAATTTAARLPAEVAAACADAPQLRQQASDELRQASAERGDQARIVRGARANFLASLAVFAELRCVTGHTADDHALDAALQAARSAETAGSFYEQANRWADANFEATSAVELLVQRLLPDGQGAR